MHLLCFAPPPNSTPYPTPLPRRCPSPFAHGRCLRVIPLRAPFAPVGAARFYRPWLFGRSLVSSSTFFHRPPFRTPSPDLHTLPPFPRHTPPTTAHRTTPSLRSLTPSLMLTCSVVTLDRSLPSSHALFFRHRVIDPHYRAARHFDALRRPSPRPTLPPRHPSRSYSHSLRHTRHVSLFFICLCWAPPLLRLGVGCSDPMCNVRAHGESRQYLTDFRGSLPPWH